MEDSGQGSSRSYHEVAREFVRRHIVDAHFGSARCSSSDDKHPNEEEADLGRPWVTVSFAQSLDGKLGMDGFQLALSSDESMAMTHQLRCVHDGILVGINTIINDDPRLTLRYLPEEQLASTENPQPIILDTHLRFPLSARLLQQALAYRDPAGGGKAQRRPAPRMPWIFASHAAHDPQRKQQLEGLGTTIVLVPHEYCDTRTHNPLLQFVLGYLWQRGIRRLMVEGGPTIIGSLFAPQRPFPAGRPPVDLCVVTVSPSWVGPAGKHIPLPSQPAARSSLPRLSDPVYQQFGPDIVVLGRPNL